MSKKQISKLRHSENGNTTQNQSILEMDEEIKLEKEKNDILKKQNIELKQKNDKLTNENIKQL